MDENYLDSLLNELSLDKEIDNDIENELDAQITNEQNKKSQKSDFDLFIEQDSNAPIDLLDNKMSVDELDELDDLANIDMMDLDFDDIDFDDIDITKLDTILKKDEINKKDLFKEDSLDISDLYEEPQELNSRNNKFNINQENDFDADSINKKISDNKEMQVDLDSDLNEKLFFDEEKLSINNSRDDLEINKNESIDDLISELSMEDSYFDSNKTSSISEDTDFDGLFDDVFSEANNAVNKDQDASLNFDELLNDKSASSNDSDFDVDDLFSALGIDDGFAGSGPANNFQKGEDNFDLLFAEAASNSDLDMLIPEIGEESDKKHKQKRTISEIIFGKPDDDDNEEEEFLAKRKEEKTANKANKKEENQVKKKEKQEKKNVKKEAAKNKKKASSELKVSTLLEEEKDNSKPVSNLKVILIFAFFIALGSTVYFGAKIFDYNRVIVKATEYFDRQRYRLAYDEVSGVEIKEKDEELRDKIYTVMYVERLYESYVNNMALKRPDAALDALLRGIEKYDSHYDTAVELNIVSDIDVCRAKIINALKDTYGIDEKTAYSILEMDGTTYLSTIYQYSMNIMKDKSNEEGTMNTNTTVDIYINNENEEEEGQ